MTKPRIGQRLNKFMLIVTALAIQACSRPLPPQESCNFVRDAKLERRVSWNKRLPVQLKIHASVPQSAMPAIERAIHQYNQVLGGGEREIFRIIESGVQNDGFARDGSSTIFWASGWDPSKTGEQARTTIFWAGENIFEADIGINASALATSKYSFNLVEMAPAPGTLDLESLMVHELGHALGLAHNDVGGSIMNVSLDQGQDRRKIGLVDLASLRCEY